MFDLQYHPLGFSVFSPGDSLLFFNLSNLQRGGHSLISIDTKWLGMKRKALAILIIATCLIAVAVIASGCVDENSPIGIWETENKDGTLTYTNFMEGGVGLVRDYQPDGTYTEHKIEWFEVMEGTDIYYMNILDDNGTRIGGYGFEMENGELKPIPGSKR